MDQRARDFLEQVADAAGIAEVEMQVIDDDQEDAAGGVVLGARGWQDNALLSRRRRWGRQVMHAAAVHQREAGKLLLDAVLVNFKIALGQVGHELVLAVAHDCIRRDVVNGHAKLRLAALGRCRRRGCLGAQGRGQGQGGQCCKAITCRLHA